jgi:hypothetical protein
MRRIIDLARGGVVDANALSDRIGKQSAARNMMDW